MRHHSLAILILLASCLPSNAATSVGKKIADFRLPDHHGQEYGLTDIADTDLVVVAFLGTQCPLAKLYAGRLQAIADEYAARGLAVVAVMSNSQDSLSDITAFARQHELKFRVLKDRRNEAADQFGAERTPQVFLLDRERIVRYAGRIDDRYLVGIARDKAGREDLRIAIDELLSGKPVSVPTTEPIGCIIGRVRKPNDKSPVTYARDIAPIFQARCVECHRAGQIGPFELASYEEAAGWGEMIAEVVRDDRMPPWHADPKHGKFANDRRMPTSEKALIAEWVKNGCPEGDPALLPEPRQFIEGWQMPREPDVVLAMGESYEVPADAGPRGVPYQRFRVATNFAEDKWITASEVRPGNRAVVHHTIVYVEPPGARPRPRRRDYIFLAGYVPGLRCDSLPERSARRIPAGSNLIFEMHYTPNGSKQVDKTEIGLWFADPRNIENEVITTEIGNDSFEIPPGAEAHVVTATSRPTKREVTMLSMSPHMHLRGKAFRYELVLPTGEREVLLDVPAYDFNWQTKYWLAEPRKLPAGCVIFCRAAYNNSKSNPANPDPAEAVRWGDQSWEEMMLGFFDVILPRDDSRIEPTKPVTTGLDIIGQFDAADGDHNNGLNEAEVAGHKLLSANFALVDRNQDKLLQVGEIITAVETMMSARDSDD